MEGRKKMKRLAIWLFVIMAGVGVGLSSTVAAEWLSNKEAAEIMTKAREVSEARENAKKTEWLCQQKELAGKILTGLPAKLREAAACGKRKVSVMKIRSGSYGVVGLDDDGCRVCLIDGSAEKIVLDACRDVGLAAKHPSRRYYSIVDDDDNEGFQIYIELW